MKRLLSDSHRKRSSLRRRVTVAQVLVVLGAILFIGAGVIWFVRDAELDSWKGREREVALGAARTVESFMDQVWEYISLISLLDRDYLVANPRVLTDLLNRNQALLEVVCLDDAGDVFASAHRGDSPILANLFTIAQSNWFLQARAGQLYTGDVQISAADEPYIILAAPAFDDGVIAARLRLNVLWDVVSGIQFGGTGRAYVVNSDGYIIAHSNHEIVLDYADISDHPEMAFALQSVDYRWNGAYRNFEGQTVVGSTMPIADSDWVIFVEISQAEAFATTRQALIVLGGGGALTGGLISLVTYLLLSRLVLKPLEDLRDGAERVGEGELSHRLESERLDEIGQVAATFNIMAAHLQERGAALAQARDEAIAASDFKSRLLAIASHDLRSPLNGIIGYAEMLQEGVYGALSDEHAKANTVILANARQLSLLITDLLDQVQIDAGNIELHPAPFSPVKLMDEIESIMGLLAHRKGLELIMEVNPALPDSLLGDQRRLQQILMNLLTNAVKFTDEGYVRVRFYPDGTYWVMEVADTGQGIPAEAQAHLFEPFRQVDRIADSKKGGVGLGLSIVRQLVDLMKGKIQLSSQVGQGSTFTISIPLHIAS